MFETLRSIDTEIELRLHVVGASIHALIGAAEKNHPDAMQEMVDEGDRIATAVFPHRTPRTFLLQPDVVAQPTLEAQYPPFQPDARTLTQAAKAPDVSAPAFDFEAAKPMPTSASDPLAQGGDDRSAAINEALQNVYAMHDTMDGTAAQQAMQINPAWGDIDSNRELTNA